MFSALYSWSCARIFSSSEVSGSTYAFQATHENTFGKQLRFVLFTEPNNSISGKKFMFYSAWVWCAKSFSEELSMGF